MIEAGLIVARLLHYVAVTTLAGASFFPLCMYAGAEPRALSRWRQGLLLVAIVVAVLSGLLWFMLSVASMSGTLAGMSDPQVIWTVIHDTGFGEVWAVRMLIAVVALVAISMRGGPAAVRKDLVAPAFAALLLASLAGVGHSQIEEGGAGVIHMLSDLAHLLAAGTWLGGLLPLGYVLLLCGRKCINAREMELDHVLQRFSRMGYFAVATLIGSGLINSWFLVGTVRALLTTWYGQLLCAKLVMFAGMLALAASNRFRLVPSLTKTHADDLDRTLALVAQLRNQVLGEQILGLLVLLAVSALGTMQPAIGQ